MPRQFNGQRQSFQQIALGQLNIHMAKEYLYLTPDIKINSKWTTGLNIRAKSIKLPNEKGLKLETV